MAFLGFGRNWLPEDLDTGLAMKLRCTVSSSSRAFQRAEDTGAQDPVVEFQGRERFVARLVESKCRHESNPDYADVNLPVLLGRTIA